MGTRVHEAKGDRGSLSKVTTESSTWCYWDVPLEFVGEIARASAVAEARNVKGCTAAARHVERLMLADFVNFCMLGSKGKEKEKLSELRIAQLRIRSHEMAGNDKRPPLGQGKKKMKSTKTWITWAGCDRGKKSEG